MNLLQDLSQGSRIAYVRNFRRLTQAELGIKCGFKPECAGTRIAQYETNKRSPKQKMLLILANALNVDAKFLGRYDFRDMNDLYYIRSWMDIVDKRFMNRHISRMLHTQSKYIAFCTGEISRDEFLNWLFKEGEIEWNQQEISEAPCQGGRA